MDALRIIARMERVPEAVSRLVGTLPPEDARWKPPSGAWSVLEIVTHLGDEEVDDFRARLDCTLRGAREWPPIDPEGWAISRRYNEQDLAASLARFAREREASIAWLKSLPEPDWSAAYQHPKFGPIRAGDLLSSWQAHDALHVRQLAKRLYELANRDAPEFSTRYAGDWKA